MRIGAVVVGSDVAVISAVDRAVARGSAEVPDSTVGKGSRDPGFSLVRVAVRAGRGSRDAPGLAAAQDSKGAPDSKHDRDGKDGPASWDGSLGAGAIRGSDA
jgi:hypothetical protein